MTKVLVLLSGGQDSTTCLYWAKQEFDEVVCMSFMYGQRHEVELTQALKISKDAGIKEHIFINVDGVLGGSSLTDHKLSHLESHKQNPDLPASFTAGRNMLFLTVAAGWAYNNGIRDIVTGVCQTDYSGYPDCRRDFINAMEETLSFAMTPDYINTPFRDNLSFSIHTPLMYLTKAETWKMANDIGVAYECDTSGNPNSMENDTQVSVLEVIINDTMTDYNGNTTKNEWGMGIDNNPATHLRVKGFYEAKDKGWLLPSIAPDKPVIK